MSLVRHNPWSIFDQLNRELSNQNYSSEDDANVAAANWTPSVDITEGENSFKLLADIPGVKPEDIDVSMDNGVLTVKGERNTEEKTEKENFRRAERKHGVFYRRFTLPETANADKIEAHSEHGVLQITIPKQEVAQARRISVKH